MALALAPAPPSMSGSPTVYRSFSSTVMAACSTSGSGCPAPTPRPGFRQRRARPGATTSLLFSPRRTPIRHAGAPTPIHLISANQPHAALARSCDAPTAAPTPGSSALHGAASRPPPSPSTLPSRTASRPWRPDAGPAGAGGCTGRLVARSISIQTATGRGTGSGSSSSSLDEEVITLAVEPYVNGSSSTTTNGGSWNGSRANGSTAMTTGMAGDLGSGAMASAVLPADITVPHRNDSTNGVNGNALHGPTAGSAAVVVVDAHPGVAVASGAVTAGPHDSARPGAAAGIVPRQEACVVEITPDGDMITNCTDVGVTVAATATAAPTVADVMQRVPDAVIAAAAAAAANGNSALASTTPSAVLGPVPGGTLPTVVDAAVAVSLRPSGFPLPPSPPPSPSISTTTVHFARGSDLASDILASTDPGAVAPADVASSPTSSTDPANSSTPTPTTAAATTSGGRSSSRIDLADTPEGLTDVEVTSVAPVADWLRDINDLTTLTYAVLTGGLVAAAVFAFDVSIQTIHDLPDIFASGLGIGGGRKTGLELFGMAVPFRCVMPAAAGLAVAWLQTLGFSPPLKALTRAMEGVTDDSAKAALPKSYWQVARKATASAITLGSGASLGPEAPSVELGANTAALIAPKHLSKRRQRMLVAAGAAAGVSAAFDAPVSGALFAVEFVLKSSRLGLDRLSTATVFVSTSVAAGVIGFLRSQGQALGIAGAGTHLVGRIPYFSIQPNLLVDVAQFSVLGLGCAVAAVALYEGVRVSEIALRPLPRWLSAPTAGALCGIIAYRFPQVQYGYVNLEELFRDSTRMSAGDLAALLTAKIVATAVCVGGGLVGGLFAPSLFLGALVGDVMGHFVAVPWGLPDPTSLVVVGAAAVLGASCRAPLTAVALMVEITRDTGLLVPLLAAIGVASLFTDYLEGVFSKRLEQALVALYLRERAFFWAASLLEPPGGGGGGGGGADGAKTVEDVLGTRASLYVRHTLPLPQAKAALAAKGCSAAVVVDDLFSPLGVVYLEDVEAELIRQRMLDEPDANFNRG